MKRISMPNFVKIGQSVAKILCVFDFSRWRPPPSWIVEFTKFYWLSVSGGSRRITVSFTYQGWRLAVGRWQSFDVPFSLPPSLRPRHGPVFKHHCIKFCQNRSFLCGDIAIFRIFKVAAAAILDFEIVKCYWLLW